MENLTQQQKELLNSIATFAAHRLEKEFIYVNAANKTIGSDCFICPPRIGETIRFNKFEYTVQNIIHVFGSSNPSEIILKLKK